VEKACIEYGVKFTWVDGLKIKTLPPVWISDWQIFSSLAPFSDWQIFSSL
jgi:hypothetical protein